MVRSAEHPSLRTVGAKGQITISADARDRLAIDPGRRLLELVVGPALVYVPADAALDDAQDAFLSALDNRGITADDVLAEIEAGKEEAYAAHYGPSR